MAKLDKLDKILITLIVICVGVLLGEITACIIFFRRVDMPDASYSMDDYYASIYTLYNEYDASLNNQQHKNYYRNMIEDQAKFGPYLYLETHMDDNSGLAILMLRTIVIDKDITNVETYCMVFAHEVMHFKTFHGNETYVSFETFKFLYESDDPYLHNVGVKYGLQQLYGYYGGEYDCHNYIINYLVKGDTK